MAAFDLEKVLNVPNMHDYLSAVEARLAEIFASNEMFESSLKQLPHGKRLRPALVFASSHAHKIEVDEMVITAAAAVELVHIASLIHDDIIDNAATRRGIPTTYAEHGMHHALLVGDFLFAAAYKQAALVNTVFAQLIAETIQTLCRGEAAELSERHNLNRTEDMVKQVAKDKTAALIAAACQAPLAYKKKQTQGMQRLGEAFGMAFQLLDDVLDFIGNPAKLGKPVGGDVGEGNYTLPLIYALESSQAGVIRMLLEKQDVDSITKTLFQNGSIQRAINTLGTYRNELENTYLEKFGNEYTTWAMHELVKPAYKGLQS